MNSDQCDQMHIWLIQYWAIYNAENQHNGINKSPNWEQTYFICPQLFAKDFKTSPKWRNFGQIWSH